MAVENYLFVNYYFRNGDYLQKYSDNENLKNLGCDSNNLWSFIVHGYRDTINTTWVSDMSNNLTKYRGGCIIIMDYAEYTTNPDYFLMVTQFEEIASVLYKKINQIIQEGFLLENGFMFGFSFGARLVFDVGVKFGGKIKRIDGRLEFLIINYFKLLNFF